MPTSSTWWRWWTTWWSLCWMRSTVLLKKRLPTCLTAFRNKAQRRRQGLWSCPIGAVARALGSFWVPVLQGSLISSRTGCFSDASRTLQLVAVTITDTMRVGVIARKLFCLLAFFICQKSAHLFSFHLFCTQLVAIGDLWLGGVPPTVALPPKMAPKNSCGVPRATISSTDSALQATLR